MILIVIGMLGKGTAGSENQRKNGDHPEYSSLKIAKNIQGFLNPEETCRHLDLSERPPANEGVKEVYNNNDE